MCKKKRVENQLLQVYMKYWLMEALFMNIIESLFTRKKGDKSLISLNQDSTI